MSSRKESTSPISVSLRTIPMVMSFCVLAVTAAICLGITSSTRETMKSLLRDASNNDIDNMYVTAADNVQRINREWQESITTSAKTFITNAVNLTFDSLISLKAEMEYALRQVGPDGKTPLGLTDSYHRSLIRHIFYDISKKPFGGLFVLMNTGGKKWQTVCLQAPWTLEPYLERDAKRDHTYVYSNGSTVEQVNIPPSKMTQLGPKDLVVEYCPVSSDGGCNSTYYRQETVKLTNGSGFVMTAKDFPQYLANFDMTPVIPWVMGMTATQGNNVWQPLTERDYLVSASIMSLIRSPLLPKDPVYGDVVGVVGAGIEIRSVSRYLRTVVKYPGQRIFVVVKSALPFPGTSTPGVLVATSHGEIVHLEGVSNKMVPITRMVMAQASSDTIISKLAKHIESTGGYASYSDPNSNPSDIVTINETKYFFKVTDIYTPEGIDWALVVAVPWEYSMGDIERNNAKTLTNIDTRDRDLRQVIQMSEVTLYVALSVSWLLILGVTYAVTVAYTKPMYNLRDDMERVAAMDLSDLPPKSRSLITFVEVRTMENAFRKMHDNLREYLESFSKYVPVEVVKDLMVKGPQATLGMAPVTAAISFSDIVNFTRMCERIPMDLLMEIVRNFFTIMTNITMVNGGVVDKYIGDCIMALWGVPKVVDKPVARSVIAALAMHRATQTDILQRLFSQAGAVLGIRTGIHYGGCLAGNLGTERRLNFTVIGDTVNLAARMEAMNKEFGTHILVTEDVVREDGIRDTFVLQLVGLVKAVGREEPCRVYGVVGLQSSSPSVPNYSSPSVDSTTNSNHTATARHSTLGGASCGGDDIVESLVDVNDDVQRFPLDSSNLNESDGHLSSRPSSTGSPLLVPRKASAWMSFYDDVEDDEYLPFDRAMRSLHDFCGNCNSGDERHANEFTTAITMYLDRQFEESRKLLTELLTRSKGRSDGEKAFMQAMIRRCDECVDMDSSLTWSGIIGSAVK